SVSAILRTPVVLVITRILRADSADVSAPRRAASEQEPLVTATHESPPTLRRVKRSSTKRREPAGQRRTDVIFWPNNRPAPLRANNYPLDGSWSSRLSPIQR